jgi:UDP-N-acetylglucosamine 4-epimerase
MYKIWITGSNGFIGSAIKKHLSEDNDVRGISNIEANDGVDFIKYEDFFQLKKYVEFNGIPDCVVHAGWGDSKNNLSELHWTSNLVKSTDFILNCYKLGINKFIGIGTSDEYGVNKILYKETFFDSNLQSKYASSKNQLCLNGLGLAKLFNTNYIHVRLFNTYGVKKDGKSLISYLAEQVKYNHTVNLTECDYSRDFIYIKDVVEAFSKIIHLNSSEIINIGSGESRELRDFVKIFWYYLGGDVKFLNFGAILKPENELPVPNGSAELEKIKKLVGWSPRYSIETGLQDLVKCLTK